MMAAISIPGQPKRWGNESTNFFQTSQSSAPGMPSRDKAYRCSDNQYTNSGHYHVGTKAINQNAPLDTYDTASARKLRPEDQRLPKPLFTSTVQAKQMSISGGQPVNLYQSHHQRYNSYAMSQAPVKRASSEEPMGVDALARSLNKAFYVTSYQSHHSRSLSSDNLKIKPSESNGSPPTLRESLLVRQNSISDDTKPRIAQRRARITSAPPLRRTSQPPAAAPVMTGPPSLQRRRSFTALKLTYSSKGEMLKDIFTAFPAPMPQAASKRQSRPSSAVTLTIGKIPRLRDSQAWV